MTNNPDPPAPPAAPDVRPERPHRQFTVVDAIGRQNADLLKGTSPMTRKRQAEAELEELLARRLHDPEGALRRVLLLWVTESEELLTTRYEAVERALAESVESILDSGASLRRLVRAADAEWGRMYLERPRFDRPGRAPDSDDPYTEVSVRETLSRLLEDLTGGAEAE